MRFSIPEPPRRSLKEWRIWFAWFPVEIEGEFVWLERVLKRRHWYLPGGEHTEVMHPTMIDYKLLNPQGEEK